MIQARATTLSLLGDTETKSKAAPTKVDEIVETSKALEEAVMKALEISPPELSADIYTNGIHLTGGGALLHGLDKRIGAKTKLPIHVADDPLKAVVKGTGEVIKNLDMYKSVLIS